MAQFSFSSLPSVPGSLMPRLSLELSSGSRTVQVNGVIDTGAPINVLPYAVGLALGAVWEAQAPLGTLAGALADVESRALAATASQRLVAEASNVPLWFAWAESDSVPVLFGQTNFFMEFNVCFYRSQNYFEVWRRD
ncbi:MAG: hypothetical protein OXG49_11150 [Chloroflexi bacterium]|nr:hypothetical protein [Chloroflexota bacterium]